MSIFDDIIISSCVSEGLVPMENRLSEFLRVFLRILSIRTYVSERERRRLYMSYLSVVSINMMYADDNDIYSKRNN